MAGLLAMGGDGASAVSDGLDRRLCAAGTALASFAQIGKFTVPDFIGYCFDSGTARLVACGRLMIASTTYVNRPDDRCWWLSYAFSKVSIITGLMIAAIVVLFYAVLGGMKGITYTQAGAICGADCGKYHSGGPYPP